MITRDDRRTIMALAWDFYRADPQDGFGCALSRSWASHRRMAFFAKNLMGRVRESGATHLRLTPLWSTEHTSNDTARRSAAYGA
jgi:hypothetical protein